MSPPACLGAVGLEICEGILDSQSQDLGETFTSFM